MLLIPNTSQTTLNVNPTDLQLPTTLDASNVIPDVTNTGGAVVDTSTPSDVASGTSSGYATL